MADNPSTIEAAPPAEAPPAAILPEPVAPTPKDQVEVWLKTAFNLRIAEGNGMFRIVPLRRGLNMVDRAVAKTPEWRMMTKNIVAPPANPGAPLSAIRAQTLTAATFTAPTVEQISPAARAAAIQERRARDAAQQEKAFVEDVGRREASAKAAEQAEASGSTAPHASGAPAPAAPPPAATMATDRAAAAQQQAAAKMAAARNKSSSQPSVADKLASAEIPVPGAK